MQGNRLILIRYYYIWIHILSSNVSEAFELKNNKIFKRCSGDAVW